MYSRPDCEAGGFAVNIIPSAQHKGLYFILAECAALCDINADGLQLYKTVLNVIKRPINKVYNNVNNVPFSVSQLMEL